MGSTLDFAEYIASQIDTAGEVSYRKMFGEYAFYVNGKVVALLCDNQLYIKPTEGGRLFIGDVVEAPPYPGAKNCFLIDDKMSDKQWLTHLVKITENELPLPVKKIKKKR